jgi:pimeloyl-ACP methyl ester carboxylesterase
MWRSSRLAAVEPEHVIVGGTRIAYRRGRGDGRPTLFVHGVPTDSRQWHPFLERAGTEAIAVDLPGFGASERRPPGEFDYSMDGITRALRGFIDAVGLDEYALVVQDWGGMGLLAALSEPDRVRRVVVLNTVPLLPGYRWHRTARIWRTPGAGELFMASVTRPFLELSLRESRPGFRRVPDDFADLVWSNIRDRVTRRAILALYRSADPPLLAAAGTGLGALDCPALVIWAGGDPYLPARFGPAYAERLPNAELVELPDAGHWSWQDRPDVVERTLSFLDSEP